MATFLDWPERYCPVCKVEGEHHFLFQCPADDFMRAKYGPAFWGSVSVLCFARFCCYQSLCTGVFQHRDCCFGHELA